MHQLKMSSWQGGSGSWYCGDIEELGKGSGHWSLPARMLGMTPAKYLEWVIKNFKPDNVFHSEDCNFVGFSWKDQSKMRKYKNYMNAEARRRKFQICQ